MSDATPIDDEPVCEAVAEELGPVETIAPPPAEHETQGAYP